MESHYSKPGRTRVSVPHVAAYPPDYVLVSVPSTKTMAGIGLIGERENHRLRVWRSEALDGMLFSRGMRMTHPYPRHWHEELHLCAYTSGSGYLAYRGNSYLVAEGEFVVTPPGEVHENWVDGESGVSFCGVYMDGSAFGRVSRQIAGRELTIPVLPDFLVRDKLVRERFLAMHLAVERGGSRLEQDELLLKFMHAFLSRCSAEGAVEAPAAYERFAVRRARDYIEANFDESISLAQLGELTALSPFYLHRVFLRGDRNAPARLPDTGTNQSRQGNAAPTAFAGRDCREHRVRRSEPSDAALPTAGGGDAGPVSELTARTFKTDILVFRQTHSASISNKSRD